jgi:hypothetical protein
VSAREDCIRYGSACLVDHHKRVRAILFRASARTLWVVASQAPSHASRGKQADGQRPVVETIRSHIRPLLSFFSLDTLPVAPTSPGCRDTPRSMLEPATARAPDLAQYGGVFHIAPCTMHYAPRSCQPSIAYSQ